jgi:hypothetical protein
MVLKPSEIAPIDAMILTEIIHEAGVPKGVFNLVNGDGPGVGATLSAHPDVDMMSFTGSTRAGVLVAQAAAPTVKRVAQELGGKSPNIVLPSADLQKAVSGGVIQMMTNSGQSCNAPSRMFVQKDQQDEAIAIAKATAESVKVMMPAEANPWRHRPDLECQPVPEGTGSHSEGHRRRRDARRRWPGPSGRLQQGLLRPPNRLRQCHQRHDDRSRGNLRTGALHPAL